MDHKNPIDNWLKQSFDQQMPPGSINRDDMAPLWDRVNQSLESKKKRFAYWWIFAAVAIGALITAGVIYTSSVSKASKNELTTEVLNNESITENQNEVNEVENKEDNTTANDELQKEEDFNPNPVVNPNLEDKNLSNNPQGVNNNKGAEAKSNKDNKIGSKPKVNKEMEGKGTIDNITNYVWFSSPIKPYVLYSPFDITLDLSKAELPMVALALGKMYPDKKPKESILPKNPWTIGLNMGLSPSKELLSIASKDLPYVHKDYLNLRDQGEKAIIASQFEFYIRKNIGHLFLQTGYSFFKTGYTQNYNYQINEIAITSQLNGNQPDAHGKYPLDDQTPYITDPTPETVTYQGQRVRSFSEVPLNIGFSFNTGKLIVTPTIGAGINFTKQIGGNTIDYQNLKLISYNDLFTKITASTNFSWNVGLIVEYPITKNLYIQAQPFYRKFLTGSTSVVQQTPITYGLNLGLNLKLHNNE